MSDRKFKGLNQIILDGCITDFECINPKGHYVWWLEYSRGQRVKCFSPAIQDDWINEHVSVRIIGYLDNSCIAVEHMDKI